MSLEIDRDVCIGSGLCTVYAPATFDIDDDARSYVKDAHGDASDQIRLAIEACPTNAIRLIGVDGGSSLERGGGE
jgi:ferredoxin